MAKNIAKKKVNFSYTAPTAQSVMLAGDFTSWEQGALPLKKNKSGVWKKTVGLLPGRYEYRLLVDGSWQDDPLCVERSSNQFGGQNCVVNINPD